MKLRQRIGISNFEAHWDPTRLKQLLLVHDRIGLNKLSHGLQILRSSPKTDENSEWLASYEWLFDNELVFDPLSDEVVVHPDVATDYAQVNELERKLQGYPNNDLAHAEFTDNFWSVLELNARNVTSNLSLSTRHDVKNLFYPTANMEGVGAPGSVWEVVLSSFPVVAPDLPFEEILSIKEDSDYQRRLSNLHRWSNKLTNKDTNPIEALEQLEESLYQYEHFMKIQNLKYSKGQLVSLVVVSSELIQSIATLNLSKAMKQLISIREKKVKLLEAELQAPGRELALISSINTSN